MEDLLTKIYNLNRLIQVDVNDPVDFTGMAKVLGENIAANVYLVGRRGKILGYYFQEGFECDIMNDIIEHSESFPEHYNRQLLLVTETVPNLTQKTEACFFGNLKTCPFKDKIMTIMPIIGGGERLGSLVIYRVGAELDTNSLVLAEYGALVVGIEILRIKTERVELDTRKKAAVQIALGTLSYSEMEAAGHIFHALAGTSGILVASRIADRVGITRSVIVNALRKLESAGVIESKSLGMKGTFIRVINENLLEELKRHRTAMKKD